MIRIISGKWRGKKIIAPADLPVRPTTDRAKEGLFNWLNFRINMEGISALDLFSGTGNIGYEFLSRGAEQVICIDEDKQCVAFINKVFGSLGKHHSRAMQARIPYVLSKMTQSFDVIFADPPYRFEEYDLLIKEVLESNLLHQESWFILEHDGTFEFEDKPFFFETRNYGKVHFTFFTKNQEA